MAITTSTKLLQQLFLVGLGMALTAIRDIAMTIGMTVDTEQLRMLLGAFLQFLLHLFVTNPTCVIQDIVPIGNFQGGMNWMTAHTTGVIDIRSMRFGDTLKTHRDITMLVMMAITAGDLGMCARELAHFLPLRYVTRATLRAKRLHVH